MSGARDLWAIMFGDRRDTIELVSVRQGDAWTTAKYGHFSYPDQIDQAEQWVLTHSVGRNVWHCAHLLMSPKKTTGATPRTKDNASNVPTLWADLDGSPLPDDLPRPTAIVQSSPGKMHCYWSLTRPLQPQDAERLNKRIAYAIKDDLSGWDLTQLLRVPGTFNFKYETAQPVTITHLDPTTRYDPIELAKLLPPAPDETKPTAPTPDAVPVNLPDSVLIAKAREAQPKFNRLWTGDFSDYIDDQHPEGDRSRADAGFCTIAAGWTGKDPARVKAWWLAAPGLKRDKLDRDDYCDKTIAFGIKECGWVYNPDGPTIDRTTLEKIEQSGSDGADVVCMPRAEYDRLQARDKRLELVEKIIANPGMKPGPKLLGVVAIVEMERRQDWGTSKVEMAVGLPAGFRCVSRARLAAGGGMSEDSVDRHLDTLRELGVVDHRTAGLPRGCPDVVTGEILDRPQRFTGIRLLTPADVALERLATATVKPKPTGKAEPGTCRDHPRAGTVLKARKSLHCEVCNDQLAQSPQIAVTSEDDPIATIPSCVVISTPQLAETRQERQSVLLEVEMQRDRENAVEIAAEFQRLRELGRVNGDAPPPDPISSDLSWWDRARRANTEWAELDQPHRPLAVAGGAE